MRGKKTKTQESAKGGNGGAGGGIGQSGGAKGVKTAARGAARPGGNGAGGATGPGGGGRRWLPVVESMGQAAHVLGAPLSLLKAAKRQGCKAFMSGSRVDLDVLSSFLWAMKPSDLPAGVATAVEWLTLEKAKRETIKRQEDERSVMTTAEACRQASVAGDLTLSELERWEREMPPALAGLTTVEVSKRMHNATEALRKLLKAKFALIGASK
jgi:hypothetical protein